MQQNINNKIINYLTQYNPTRIGIFGSFARGENTKSSDIDILVDFKDKITLFDLGGIKMDLSDILQRPVDIVTERGLNNSIKEFVYKDLKIIYK